MNFPFLSKSTAILLGVVGLCGRAWGVPIPEAVKLASMDIPAGCQLIAGIHSAGTKSGLLYDYSRYSAVLPPLAGKGEQSFQCGDQKGSLLFFLYKSDADRDQAELFAKPVLSNEEGATQPLEIREWSQGFVVVSFKSPPPELVAALDRKLAGEAAAPPPAVAMPVHVPVSAPVAPPAAPFVPVVRTPLPAPTPTPRVPSSPPALKIAAPLPPVFSEPVKVSPLSGSLTDLDPAVITAYSSKLGCDTDGSNPQTASVCALLKEFIAGTHPDTPLQEGPMLGPIYTIDSYGRFVDLHYDVLMRTDEPTIVSFISIVSTGGEQDFEIQTLLEARKSGKPLTANSILAKIQQLAPKKRLALGATNGKSLIILPGGARRVYIRRSGDHLILVGPSGKTFDEQTRSSLVVSPLY